jgi:C-terminal processing protease CtpA/Prc
MWYRNRLSLTTALVAAALAPAAPLAAQQGDTLVRVRASTPYEAQVEQIARELVMRQRLRAILMREMEGLRVSLRSTNTPDGERAAIEQVFALKRSRLDSLETQRVQLQRQLSQLCHGEATREGWVGIYLSGEPRIDRESGGTVVRYLDYPTVVSVEPGSPAEKSGVQSGDLLLALAGRDMRQRDLVFSALLKPGTLLPMRVRRGVETKQFNVRIERRPDDFDVQCPWVDEVTSAATETEWVGTVQAGPRAVIAPRVRTPSGGAVVRVTPRPAAPRATPEVPDVPPPTAPPPPGIFIFPGGNTPSFAGAQFTTLNPDLGEFFGVERGILVLNIGRGTPAEESGLRPGDVIVSAGGRAITSAAALSEVLSRAERQLSLQVVRKRRGMDLDLKW